MKRTILILACFALTISSASVMGAYGNITKGFRLGVNLARVAEHPLDSDFRTTYAVGAFINSQYNDWFSYQIEMMFIGKGYRLDANKIIDSVNGEVNYLFTYFEIPLTVKLRLPLRGKYHPYAVGGFYGSAKVGDKVELRDETAAIVIDTEKAEAFEGGILLGTGMEIKAGRGNLILETRVEIGLTRVIEANDASVKSRLISFQAGYRW